MFSVVGWLPSCGAEAVTPYLCRSLDLATRLACHPVRVLAAALGGLPLSWSYVARSL